MKNLSSAVISTDLLQNVIDNREYNKTIIKYYNFYIYELRQKLKLLKDFYYLFSCLSFSISNKDRAKARPYYSAIIGMSENLGYNFDGQDLFSLSFLIEIQEHLEETISDLEKSIIRTISNKVENMGNCNKFWDIDKFIEHKEKWVKKQNLCHDRFCSNCKKVKQAARMENYFSLLQEHQEKLYHLVLTLPNCKGNELLSTYKNMAKCFKTLTRYLSGNLKIKGIDFISWKYQGAVRSLEVTYKKNSYHPHFHVGLVIDPLVWSKKNIENKYSFDYRGGISELKRLFNEHEILIQKIWYLLINGIKVTKKSIEELEEGYSCTMDKFPSEDFAELFKYMTKDKDEEGQILTYDNFKVLYEGLYRVKQIQGYGVLYKIDDKIDLEKYEVDYEKYIEELIKKESPVEVREKPQELILDTQYKILNKKSYIKYLRQL